MSPDGIEEMKKLQIEPAAWLATVDQLRKETTGHEQQDHEQVNNVFHTTTKAELIKYLHQAAFSPVKATWKKAIENGHFTTWPGLTPEAVEKYLPRHSPATDKGHMSRQKQGIRPTKSEKWAAKKLREWRQESSEEAAAWLNSEEAAEDMAPRQEESKMNELFCATLTIDPKSCTEIDPRDGTTYMDCTGKFPVRSLEGMVTMFIMYDWSSNSILAEPIESTKNDKIIEVFREKIEYLKKRGFKPRFNILDNIASKAIIKYLKEEAEIGVQLVEPHNHRVNAAERAIRTFKSHFIAGLCTCHSEFPLVLWPELVPQAQDTLNMLRRARTHPKLSAYHVLEGVHDYNRVP